MLEKKDQVCEKFIELKNMHVETQFGRKIKVLRIDNGGEYVSNKFRKFLKNEGIVHHRTVPKNPEQNDS